MTNDAHDLDRFVDAQQPVFEQVMAELRAARKRSHWMWFVFPQLRGLGFSPTAQHFGIASLAEAKAYLAHPVLGPRLVESTEAVLAAPAGATLGGIFGSPDDMKFRSSMTLFREAAAPSNAIYQQALDRFSGGEADARTLQLLGSRGA